MSQFDTPMLRNAARKTALAARRSGCRCRARARGRSPAAGPLTAAITGCGVARSLQDQPRHVLLVAEPVARRVGAVVARARRRSRAGRRPRRSRGPAPVSTTARQERSAAIAVELLVQRLAQLGGHRVELVRAVERQHPHGRRRSVGRQDVGHGPLLSRGVAYTRRGARPRAACRGPRAIGSDATGPRARRRGRAGRPRGARRRPAGGIVGGVARRLRLPAHVTRADRSSSTPTSRGCRCAACCCAARRCPTRRARPLRPGAPGRGRRRARRPHALRPRRRRARRSRRRFGCQAYGSASLAALMGLHGLGEQAVEVEPYRTYELGPVRGHLHAERALEAAARPRASRTTASSPASTSTASPRAPTAAARSGGSTIAVAGITLYHQGSANLIDDAIRAPRGRRLPRRRRRAQLHRPLLGADPAAGSTRAWSSRRTTTTSSGRSATRHGLRRQRQARRAARRDRRGQPRRDGRGAAASGLTRPARPVASARPTWDARHGRMSTTATETNPRLAASNAGLEAEPV